MPEGSIPNLNALVSDAGGQPNPSQQSYGYIDPLNRSDNSNHRNTLTVSKYSFVNDAYNGSGGFFNGYYLVPYIIETMYPERRELATYKNYVRPIVDAMVNPVFGKPLNRIVKTTSGITLEDSLFKLFTEDCTNSGVVLDAFSKGTTKEAVLQGVSFIVMDNVPSEIQPATEQEAKDIRSIPYVYMMTQQQVKEYELDKYNRITSITFIDNPVKEKDKFGNDVESQRYRKWDKHLSVLLREEKVDNKYIMVPVEPPKAHDLGFVPVYAEYWSKPKGGQIAVDSPQYEIAKLCWGIYNLDSERREVERKQGFSMLCIQGQSSTSINVGAGNVLFYDSEAKQAPSYAAPSADIIRVIREETDDMIKRLYEIAEQNGVTATGAKEASGISKEWDFRAHEFILQSVCDMVRKANEWIVKVFNAYTKQDYVVTAKYPERFAPNSRIEDVKTLDALLMLNISPTANKIIKLEAFKSNFPDVNEDILMLIEDEINGNEPDNSEMAEEEPENPDKMGFKN